MLSKVVLLDFGLDSQPGDIPSRLHTMYLDLVRFCKEQKLDLHLGDLTRNILSFERNCDFPTGKLSCKIISLLLA